MRCKFILMLLVLTLLTSLASAEIYMYNGVSTDTSLNLTTNYLIYNVEDTSDGFRWRDREIQVDIQYLVQSLPFSLDVGSVDWCNMTMIHIANDYDTLGDYVGTTTTQTSLYFSSGSSSGTETFEMKDADDLLVYMKCHYTGGATLYDDNILVGRVSSNTPSYSCDECIQFTLEELSDELGRSQEITESELEIYETIDTLIELNHRLWLYASWIIKLFLLVFSIGLIFMGIYHLYKFLEDVARRI